MNRCSRNRFLEIQNQTEMNTVSEYFFQWIYSLVELRKRAISKAQVQRLRFSLHQVNINALGLPLLPVRERTARALSKKAKCQWPASLHLWSNRVSSIFFSSKNLFLLFDPKHFFNSFQSYFFLSFFLFPTNRMLYTNFYFLFFSEF